MSAHWTRVLAHWRGHSGRDPDKPVLIAEIAAWGNSRSKKHTKSVLRRLVSECGGDAHTHRLADDHGGGALQPPAMISLMRPASASNSNGLFSTCIPAAS